MEKFRETIYCVVFWSGYYNSFEIVEGGIFDNYEDAEVFAFSNSSIPKDLMIQKRFRLRKDT